MDEVIQSAGRCIAAVRGWTGFTFRNGRPETNSGDGPRHDAAGGGKHLEFSRRRTSLPRLGMAAEKLHYLNPGAGSIRSASGGSRNSSAQLAALSELKRQLEQRDA